MENHIQLLLHTLVMRCHRHSFERGTRYRNDFSVVPQKRHVGHHCHHFSRNNVVHGRETIVFCVKTVQEAEQVRRGRADRGGNEHYKTLWECI